MNKSYSGAGQDKFARCTTERQGERTSITRVICLDFVLNSRPAGYKKRGGGGGCVAESRACSAGFCSQVMPSHDKERFHDALETDFSTVVVQSSRHEKWIKSNWSDIDLEQKAAQLLHHSVGKIMRWRASICLVEVLLFHCHDVVGCLQW